MKKNIEKPSTEAKALSLFLMAHKATSPTHKEKAKRINRQWDLVMTEKLSKDDYLEEVKSMLTSFGGYSAVVEKTVKFYIDKTGEWTLAGNDKYCKDAKKIADKMLSK
ncbi:MAG: hypothetical protein ACI865_001768 [Flavobacteriaceae bacterium]|jgi:hypothetical protein